MNNLIAVHLSRCRAAGLSPVTIRDRGELLYRLERDLPLGLVDATTEDFADWLSGPNWSPETLKTYYNHIVGFCKDMRQQIGWDASAGLIRPRVPQGLPRPASEDELRYALATLAPPWDLYVMLAGYGGLRCAEVAGLDRRNVSKDEILIYRGKGGKSRTVETYPELWNRIRLLPPGPIALLGSGRVMTAQQMSGRMTYRLDKIGLPDLTLHRFRSRFATMLLRPKKMGGAGADLLTVSDLMGHSSPNTTKVYTLITSEQRRLAIDALPALAPASR